MGTIIKVIYLPCIAIASNVAISMLEDIPEKEEDRNRIREFKNSLTLSVIMSSFIRFMI